MWQSTTEHNLVDIPMTTVNGRQNIQIWFIIWYFVEYDFLHEDGPIEGVIFKIIHVWKL